MVSSGYKSWLSGSGFGSWVREGIEYLVAREGKYISWIKVDQTQVMPKKSRSGNWGEPERAPH